MCCYEELPHLQTLYTRLASQGVIVLALNRGRSETATRRYMVANRLTLPVAMADTHTPAQYGLPNALGAYLLDASGKVVWSQPEGKLALQAALEKLGVK